MQNSVKSFMTVLGNNTSVIVAKAKYYIHLLVSYTWRGLVIAKQLENTVKYM